MPIPWSILFVLPSLLGYQHFVKAAASDASADSLNLLQRSAATIGESPEQANAASDVGTVLQQHEDSHGSSKKPKVAKSSSRFAVNGNTKTNGSQIFPSAGLPTQLAAYRSKDVRPKSAGGNLRPHEYCNGRQVVPPISGEFEGDMMQIPHCFYNMRSKRELTTGCLGGLWMVFAGGSGSMLSALDLINWIAPSWAKAGQKHDHLDVIIDNGKVVHFAQTTDIADVVSRQSGILPSAPARTPTSTRITAISAHFFTKLPAALTAISEAPGGWAKNVALSVQISRWYAFCYESHYPFCERNQTEHVSAATQLRQETDLVLKPLTDFCTVGPGKNHGCAVEGDQDDSLNAVLRTLIQSVGHDNLRFLDVNTIFSSDMKVGSDHLTPFLNLWLLQIKFAGFCPVAVDPPVGTPVAHFTGFCLRDGKKPPGTETMLGKCPEYDSKCHAWPWGPLCFDWMCARYTASHCALEVERSAVS